MEAIEAALCEAVEMHDGLVSEDFIDLFVSQVTPLSDSRFAWCLDFSPQPTVAFLNLAGQRKYTTCSMDSKLHFGPFADEDVYKRQGMGRPKRNCPPDLQNAGCLLQARRRSSSRFDESER